MEAVHAGLATRGTAVSAKFISQRPGSALQNNPVALKVCKGFASYVPVRIKRVHRPEPSLQCARTAQLPFASVRQVNHGEVVQANHNHNVSGWNATGKLSRAETPAH